MLKKNLPKRQSLVLTATSSPLMLACFALTGGSTIMYEITLSRHAELALGATVDIAALTLSLLLLGFAIGSYWLRPVADTQKAPFKKLAYFELLIALLIALSPFITSFVVKPIGLFLPSALMIVPLGVITLPVAILLGALWPLVSAHYVNKNEPGDVGYLVTANTLAGGLMALCTGFLLVPRLGFLLTTLLAASFNIIAAGIFYSLRQRA